MVKKLKFDAVIWDWNGTLLNDTIIAWECANVVMTRHGKGMVTFEEYQRAYRHPLTDMYKELGFDLELEAYTPIFSEWHSLYNARVSGEAELHEDAIETLTSFKEYGAQQAVLSALQHDSLMKHVTSFGLIPYFEQTLGLSGEDGSCKRGNGSILLGQLAVNPEKTLIVGDSTHDAEVARFLGAECLLVRRGSEDLDRLLLNGYPVLASLNEVLDFVF
jgi:phosphoglycolate phosphatase